MEIGDKVWHSLLGKEVTVKSISGNLAGVEDDNGTRHTVLVEHCSAPAQKVEVEVETVEDTDDDPVDGDTGDTTGEHVGGDEEDTGETHGKKKGKGKK